MASISTDGNGNRTIQFVAGDGKRRSIRLGKLPLKAVREIKTKVEALSGAGIAKISIDRETSEWLGSLDSVLYDKLAAVALVPKRAEAERTTLAPFIDAYLAGRAGIKGATLVAYRQTRRNLVAFFGEGKPLAEITPGDADDWRAYLIQQELAEATVRRRSGVARQFFRAAERRKLLVENPFADIKAGVKENPARMYFVGRDDSQRVLDACPDAQWRLIFALSRFGGLRCPSEHLGLRWGDIDWEHGRMLVLSPKTEHHEGHESRMVPIFPELRPYLEQVFDAAEPGTEFVITRFRDATQNLRSQMLRIIQRAGLKPWPKLFQNLRSTRQTELEQRFPTYVVCNWMGNTQAVARKHYLQMTEAHYQQALQNPVQSGAEMARNAPQAENEKCELPQKTRGCETMQVGEWAHQDSNLGPQPYQGCALTN